MDDLATRIVQGIPADSDFTESDRTQALNLINACHLVATRAVTPWGLGSNITRNSKGFGPWLDTVRRAIESADMPPLERATLLGAFEMAGVILFDAGERRTLRDRQ